MIIEINAKDRHMLSNLFEGYQYQRVFIDGTLAGQFGKAWADSIQSPKVAILNHALTYLGGDATIPAAKELLKKAITTSESLFVSSPAWENLILNEYPEKYVPMQWTSLSSKLIEIKTVQQLKHKLPTKFTVKRIDKTIAKQLFEERVLIYRTYDKSSEKFVEEGVGFCIYDEDKVASVINSMAIYNNKLKGNIETIEQYRGIGLATCVAAHLVEYCLDNNIDYQWEATNKASIAVAKKLGFVEEGKMTVYQNKEYLPADELN